MNIIVWGINYAPELTGIGPYNTALCEFLQARGHRVRMVTTFPYYPEWEKRPGDQQLFRKDRIEDVEVFRCWHFVPQQVTTGSRILHELSFVLTSLARILVLPRPDLILVISPPLFLGLAAWFASLLKRSPFMVHVQDLQPDAAAGLGLIQRPALLKMLYQLEQFVYAKAIRLSGISRRMLELFEKKGVRPEKLIFFPNGVSIAPSPVIPGLFRERYGFSADHFLVVYSGNLGLKQGLDVLIEAARSTHHPRIRFVICGSGVQRESLERKVRDWQLRNVMFLQLHPLREFEQMLADANVCVVTQRKGTGDYFFPSKLLPILAARRPVLTVADESSELAKAVREGKFGQNLPPDQPQELARAIEALSRQPDRLREWGEAGRAFAAAYEMNTVLSTFEQALQDIFGKG